MKIGFKILMLLALCPQLSYSQVNNTILPREKLSLDKEWRFFEGDIPMPVIRGHGMTYQNAKAGKSWGAADPAFDDTKWRVVNLPHDWAVEQPSMNLQMLHKDTANGA